MKAHTDSRSRRIAREEYENVREEIFRQCADDILAQTLINVFWTLNRSYGWGKKRLADFVEALHDTTELQCKPSRMHHRFSALDCEKELKEKYGIDVREEFKAIVEVKE